MAYFNFNVQIQIQYMHMCAKLQNTASLWILDCPLVTTWQ